MHGDFSLSTASRGQWRPVARFGPKIANLWWIKFIPQDISQNPNPKPPFCPTHNTIPVVTTAVNKAYCVVTHQSHPSTLHSEERYSPVRGQLKCSPQPTLLSPAVYLLHACNGRVSQSVPNRPWHVLPQGQTPHTSPTPSVRSS